MVNRIFLAVVLADILFLTSGALELGFSLVVQSQLNDQPDDGKDATRKLMYRQFPLTAGIVNGVFILVAFVLTLPGMWLPARGWLKLSGAVVTICGLFTLIVGLYLWVLTLRFKENFNKVYIEQTPQIQDLIQTSFECCGYNNSTSPAFVTSNTCPSPAAAALVRGCAGSVSSFANVFLDNIFTGVFGMVGVDALFVLALACLAKERKERERYRYIDEKSGFSQI